MSPKKIFIKNLANHLANTGTVMSGSELGEHLNRNGIQTDYGTDFAGKRGVYTLVSASYHELVKLGLTSDANNVAKAFVKEDGTPAYL